MQCRGNDVSQEELAKAIGVSREIIQHWERGSRHIKADHLCMLAKHFGVSADWLLGLSVPLSGDPVKRAAEEYTGLTSDAVQFLHNYKKEYPGRSKVFSDVLQSQAMDGLLLSLANIKAYCDTYPAIIESERESINHTNIKSLNDCQVRTYHRRQEINGEMWAFSDYAQKLVNSIYPLDKVRNALDCLYDEVRKAADELINQDGGD